MAPPDVHWRLTPLSTCPPSICSADPATPSLALSWLRGRLTVPQQAPGGRGRSRPQGQVQVQRRLSLHLTSRPHRPTARNEDLRAWPGPQCQRGAGRGTPDLRGPQRSVTSPSGGREAQHPTLPLPLSRSSPTPCHGGGSTAERGISVVRTGVGSLGPTLQSDGPSCLSGGREEPKEMVMVNFMHQHGEATGGGGRVSVNRGSGCF